MSRFEIPVVETERLVLRGFRGDDLDAFAAMSADPEVMRYVGTGGAVVGIDSFGASAPAKKLFEHFGFTPENVTRIVSGLL